MELLNGLARASTGNTVDWGEVMASQMVFCRSLACSLLARGHSRTQA